MKPLLVALLLLQLAGCSVGGVTLWHRPTAEERAQQKQEEQERADRQTQREEAKKQAAQQQREENLRLDRLAPQVLLAHSLTDVSGCERLPQVRGHSDSELNAPPHTRSLRELYREEYFFTARREAARAGGNRLLRVTDTLYDVYRCP